MSLHRNRSEKQGEKVKVLCENPECETKVPEIQHHHEIRTEMYLMIESLHGQPSQPLGLFLTPEDAIQEFEEIGNEDSAIERNHQWFVDHPARGPMPMHEQFNPLSLDEDYAVLYQDGSSTNTRLYRMSVEGLAWRYGKPRTG